MKKIKYFSTFTGVGGLEFGLEEIGECVGFSEIKKPSIQIYLKNHPGLRNYGDITKIEPTELPDFNLFIGGFPCQSFSLAGMRAGFKDKRGKMIFYIYDILKVKTPDYFVLENVKGILNHDGGNTYSSVVKLLRHAGYNVRVVLLNAIHYGTAQNRERVFFLGSRKKFREKIPVIIDDTKRFKDVREYDVPFKFIKHGAANARNERRIQQETDFSFELIGTWDRVGCLTTQYGCGEKVVWEPSANDFRFLTVHECEQLQGFPIDWTAGVSDANRYWAIGNAVSPKVSEYLFKEYLKGLWW